MAQFLTIIIVMAAIILTFVVLIQNSKGGGLAAGFASANQVFGVRKTTDRIEKLTWILIGTIVVLSVFSSRLATGNRNASAISEIPTEAVQTAQQQAQQQQTSTQPVQQQSQPVNSAEQNQ